MNTTNRTHYECTAVLFEPSHLLKIVYLFYLFWKFQITTLFKFPVRVSVLSPLSAKLFHQSCVISSNFSSNFSLCFSTFWSNFFTVNCLIAYYRRLPQKSFVFRCQQYFNYHYVHSSCFIFAQNFTGYVHARLDYYPNTVFFQDI